MSGASRDSDRGEWHTVKDAAELLGVSVRTVWRRIAAQELDIDRSVTPHLVRVSDTDTDRRVPESAKVSEVSRLEAEVERLSGLLEEVRSERDYLRRAHAAALATSQRLLEHVEVAEVQEEREPVGVLSRLRQWFGGDR
jgi:hypothetical protein